MIFYDILLMPPWLLNAIRVYKTCSEQIISMSNQQEYEHFDQSHNEKEYKQVFLLNWLKTILVVTVEP